MVKSADTADLKSADPYQVVGVQVPLRAPSYLIDTVIYNDFILSLTWGFSSAITITPRQDVWRQPWVASFHAYLPR
jgi:hypothetical protein